MIFKTTPQKLIKKALKKGYKKDELWWVFRHPYAATKYGAVGKTLLDVEYKEELWFKCSTIGYLPKYIGLYGHKKYGNLSDTINFSNPYLLIGECD